MPEQKPENQILRRKGIDLAPKPTKDNLEPTLTNILEKLEEEKEKLQSIPGADLNNRQKHLLAGYDELTKAKDKEDWTLAAEIMDALKRHLEGLENLTSIIDEDREQEAREQRERMEREAIKKIMEKRERDEKAACQDLEQRLEKAQQTAAAAKAQIEAELAELDQRAGGVGGFFRRVFGSIDKDRQTLQAKLAQSDPEVKKLSNQLDQATKKRAEAKTAWEEAKSPEEEKNLTPRYEELKPGEQIQSFTLTEMPTGIDPNSIETNNHHEFARDLGGVAVTAAVTDFGGQNSKYPDNEDLHAVAVNPNDPASLGEAAGAVNILTVDGAGGSANGELAAAFAAHHLMHALRKGVPVDRALTEANQAIFTDLNGGNFDPKNSSYCCATVIQIRKNRQVDIGSVGDTKVLTIRNGESFAPGTTRLQNLATKWLEAGQIEEKDYFTHPQNNVITNTLGNAPEAYRQERAPILTFRGEDGDLLIAASDGVWDVVSEYEIKKLAEEVKQADTAGVVDPQILQEKIYHLAYERNNTTSNFIIQVGPEIENTNTFCKTSGDNITISVTRLDFRVPEARTVTEERRKQEAPVRSWFRDKVLNNKLVREALVAGGLLAGSVGLAIWGPDGDETESPPTSTATKKDAPEPDSATPLAEITFTTDEARIVEEPSPEDKATPATSAVDGQTRAESRAAAEAETEMFADAIATPGTNPIRLLDEVIARPGLRATIITSERSLSPTLTKKSDDWVVKNWRTKQWWDTFNPKINREQGTVAYRHTVRADQWKTTILSLQQLQNGEIQVSWHELGGEVKKPYLAASTTATEEDRDLRRTSDISPVGERARPVKLENDLKKAAEKIIKGQFSDNNQSGGAKGPTNAAEVGAAHKAAVIPATGDFIQYNYAKDRELLAALAAAAIVETPPLESTGSTEKPHTNNRIATLREKIERLIQLTKEERAKKLKEEEEKSKSEKKKAALKALSEKLKAKT